MLTLRIFRKVAPAIIGFSTLFAVTLSCSEDEETLAQKPPAVSAYNPSFGMVGQTITIAGNNFGTSAKDVEVYFYDAAKAEITELSNTSIKVVIPENAYKGPIRVKVGEVETVGPDFTVQELCYVFFPDVGNILVPCDRIKSSGV